VVKLVATQLKIFNLKTALALLRQGFEKGLVSPSESGKEWLKRVWAVSKNGEVLEGRHSGGGRYHGFPVLDDSPIETIVRQRWNTQDE